MSEDLRPEHTESLSRKQRRLAKNIAGAVLDAHAAGVEVIPAPDSAPLLANLAGVKVAKRHPDKVYERARDLAHPVEFDVEQGADIEDPDKLIVHGAREVALGRQLDEIHDLPETEEPHIRN